MKSKARRTNSGWRNISVGRFARALLSAGVAFGIFALLDATLASTLHQTHPVAYLCFLPIWIATRVGGKVSGLIFALACAIWLNYPDLHLASFTAHFSSLGVLVLISDYLEGSLARASRLAMHDSLTGLQNRRSGTASAEAMILAAQRRGKSLAIIVLDCNHFKQINDQWGHAEGDRALKLIARGIKRAVRAHDVVARLGGDEFFVVLEGADLSLALNRAAQIKAHVSAIGQSTEFSLSVSAGVAVLGRDGGTLEDLLARADTRMFRQKSLTHALVTPASIKTRI